MNILNLLGWLFVGKEGVKDAYTNHKTNSSNKEFAKNVGSATYVDSKGKLRMLSNNKKVYPIMENGHRIYRYVDTGAVAFDATERLRRQGNFSCISIARKWGKEVIPLENKEREQKAGGYYGMEIETGKEFWATCADDSGWLYFGSDDILTTFNEEEKKVETRLTMDEMDKYRGLKLIKLEKDYNSNKELYEYFYERKIKDVEKEKQLKEDRLWAKDEHVSRMKRLYGENWEERLDMRGREDRIIFSFDGFNLPKEIFYFLYNKYYSVYGKGWKVCFDEQCMDGKAWFTLGQLICEFFQKLFDEKESGLGYIRVTDVTAFSKFKNDFDPFNPDPRYCGVPLKFRLVCDMDFSQKLLEAHKKYRTEYKEEYAEEYKKMIEEQGLSKVACSHESYIENIERDISEGEAHYAESHAIWYMLCDGDMSSVPELENELVEYIKGEMSCNETWKANYEKGVELANEQKEKAGDNESHE